MLFSYYILDLQSQGAIHLTESLKLKTIEAFDDGYSNWKDRSFELWALDEENTSELASLSLKFNTTPTEGQTDYTVVLQWNWSSNS
ncbi:hypothetical protein TNCV_393161 [Trichonephila clavipes]|nr:hypothetical protein TNCV_393161 [Trichonephila clavipes]